MILHIPVEGGHKGGRVKLAYRDKTKTFFNHIINHRQFHVWAFHTTCQQVLEPLTSGAMALLVVRLVWTNPPMDPLFRQLDVPAFLESLADVRTILDRSAYWCWDVNGEHDSCSCHSDGPDYDYAYGDDEGFFIFLKNKYGPAQWKFSSLKGEDRLLAIIFLLCPSAEVHLAMVKQNFKEDDNKIDDDVDDSSSRSIDEDDDKMPPYSVYNWMNPEDRPIHLTGLGGYLRSRLVINDDNCCLKLKEKPSGREPDSVELLSKGARMLSYDTPALFVWPKKKSLDFYFRYGFDVLLDRLESSSNDGGGLEDLGRILKCIRKKAARVWTDSNGADRAERLLYLCVRLGAKEEGLDLLDLLNTEFSSGGTEKTFEGIRNDRVAQAVADFECQVGGKVQMEFFQRKYL